VTNFPQNADSPSASREPQNAPKLGRILREVGDYEEPVSTAGATAGGDGRCLRGIPVIGKGAGGAVFGADPLRAPLAKESRSRLSSLRR
jgi:hypothetical protein